MLFFQRRGDVGAVYVKCQSHNGPVIQGILKRNFVINGIDNNIFKIGSLFFFRRCNGNECRHAGQQVWMGFKRCLDVGHAVFIDDGTES